MTENSKLHNMSSLLKRPDLVSVGTIVWLSSELMFFAGIFAMYFTLKSTSSVVWLEETKKLDVSLSLINTIILLISSLTCQIGVVSVENLQHKRSDKFYKVRNWGMVEWYTLSLVLGICFLFLQVFEYKNLISHGVTISSNAYGSAFYITTGFHWLHVLGGVIAFIFFVNKNQKLTAINYLESASAIAIAYYWHFVDAIWVILFLVIYFLK